MCHHTHLTKSKVPLHQVPVGTQPRLPAQDLAGSGKSRERRLLHSLSGERRLVGPSLRKRKRKMKAGLNVLGACNYEVDILREKV